MTGTVTIPLKEFDKLRESSSIADKRQERVLQATKELEVFLSFMCTREHIQPLVEEFNRQSSNSTISLENGRAKIIFNDE